MMASQPVRLLSLAIVALIVTLGIRGVVSGFALNGHLAGRPEPGAGDVERTSAVVAYVLDGDTFEVRTRDGREVRVRLLGVAADEIPHPGKPGECYGQAATRHLEQLLPAGTHVRLVSDPTQDDVDAYGRWLRYVQVSGRDVGAAQIRSGAAAARDSSTPVARFAAYAELEREARDRSAGMWSACR